MRATMVIFALFFAASACGGKDANTQLCLDDHTKLKGLVAAKDDAARELAGLVYQTCGLSCDIMKDADACGAFKEVTALLCDKEGKDTCKTLCEGSNGKKNESACALVK